MSKPKNRWADEDGDRLVHATYRPRRNNYWATRCRGLVVYDATNQSIPLTCLVCWDKEQRNGANRNDR